MIHLITGLPGNGKTLYALNYVVDLAKVGNRPVYYSGIDGLTLPWTLLDDPSRWDEELPSGAIFILDEAQTLFRPRGNGAAVPSFVAGLETHRHKGLDIILISQHPMLLDNAVRRLAGRHMHVVRMFGMAGSTVHEWGEVKTDCDKNRLSSVRHKFLFPKASYSWYKSAEVHTHTRRIPARVFLLIAIPLLLVACIWFASNWFSGRGGHMEKEVLKAGGVQASAAGGGGAVKVANPPLSYADLQRNFAQDRAPMIPGLAFTAQRYAKVTEPKVAPAPVACVKSASKGCRCYTSQGTLLADVDPALCASIVAGGFFMEWVEPARPDAAAPIGAQAMAGANTPLADNSSGGIASKTVPDAAGLGRARATPGAVPPDPSVGLPIFQPVQQPSGGVPSSSSSSVRR